MVGCYAIFNDSNDVTRHIAIVVEVLMGLDVITATDRLANPQALGISIILFMLPFLPILVKKKGTEKPSPRSYN